MVVSRQERDALWDALDRIRREAKRIGDPVIERMAEEGLYLAKEAARRSGLVVE
jgi:hypothetical protein